MRQYPEHIQARIKEDQAYFSLDNMANIERCKRDPEYLGDVMVVNENLIWHSIHKYIGQPEQIVRYSLIEKDDILQLGRIGFIKAIKAFDTQRGVRFSAFAVTAIVREVKCFLRDRVNLIRPTRTARELMSKIQRLEKEMRVLPSAEKVAMLLDVEVHSVKKALLIGKQVVYLDEPYRHRHATGGETMETSLLHMIADRQAIENEVVDKVFTDALVDLLRSKLKEEEFRVLQWKMHGFNQTQAAEKGCMSQMRVSRIMRKVSGVMKETLQVMM